MATTRPAPSIEALWIANWATGPHPHTAIVSPFSIPAFSAAMYPVGKISDRKRTFSSGRSDSILNGPTSAYGTRKYSACPPAYPPSIWENPNNPAGDWPISSRATSAFGFDESQSENSSRLQYQQVPHEMVNGTTTLSPFFSRVTPLPTSSTMPMGSWPRMSPASMVG